MDFRSESTYKETRLPVEYASTLLPEAYRSPEYHVEEQSQLFGRSWVALAARSEITEPGQAIVRSVAGRSVIVTMGSDGEMRAFLNVCRHRGSRLIREDCTLRANRIRCPYHAWAYDLDGNCIGTPLFEGSDIPEDMQAAFDMTDTRAFDRGDYPLFGVSVRVWGPLILVSLDPDTTPLGDWLGDLDRRLDGYEIGDWVIQRRKDYDIGANWKLIAENFMEYYHLPWVHPELAKVSRIQDHYRFQGPGMYTGMMTSPISGSGSAWMALPPHEGVPEADRNSGKFMLLFPNAALSILPNHCFLMIMEPVGHDMTLERCFILTHPDSMLASGAEEAMAALVEFWDGVNLEDIDIVEGVQLGLSTPEYQGGRMCYRFEEPVHRFQNMIVDRMVGVDHIPPGDETERAPMFGE
ncbi:MAG: aromatic ring-hydroxylating dioxygenase subunit alpha [Acidimicrobiia bacterium]